MRSIGFLFIAALLLNLQAAQAANPWGLKEGAPGLKSAGPLVFGPDGVLLVGDTKAATVFAIQTADSDAPLTGELSVTGLNEKAAKVLGVTSEDITINDLAANPGNGNVFLSIANAKTGAPALLQVNGKGEISVMDLENVAFAKVVLPNAPEDKEVRRGRRVSNARDDSITDVAYSEGRVYVSGLSKSQSASSVRAFDFPFSDSNAETSLEIYHGAHGRFETNAAIRTFVPFNIDGEPNLLAGFQCTPLVKFPVKGISSGQVRGTTIAELGNRNRPLDMIVYKKDGQDFLLMANDRRGVMKISTDDISRKEGITSRVGGGGIAGQSYETIEDLDGVVQLDKLDDQRAVILVKSESGSQDLKTILLP